LLSGAAVWAEAMRKFVIDDTSHAEAVGEFASLAEAVSELRRLAALPWDETPNVAPCMSWETCGRCYEIVEYEIDGQPWRELRRLAAFEVSSKGVVWSMSFESDIAGPAA
jgi:hypothetical protein